MIHGDFTQFDRDAIMNKFKNNQVKVLVATDVAGDYFIFIIKI